MSAFVDQLADRQTVKPNSFAEFPHGLQLTLDIVRPTDRDEFRDLAAALRDLNDLASGGVIEQLVERGSRVVRADRSHGTIVTVVDVDTVEMFRPVGPRELERIHELNDEAFPPRHQPIFYPVLNEDYARKIARDWNATKADTGYRGFVTRFRARADYLAQFDVQTVGASWAKEIWVPAEDLDEFNANIVGKIEVVAEYRGAADIVPTDIRTEPRFVCPVCGYADLRYDPRPSFGGGSFEICPSCGFQFGVTDDDAGVSFEDWRRTWVKDGMKWSSSRQRPPNWDPVAQLEALASH